MNNEPMGDEKLMCLGNVVKRSIFFTLVCIFTLWMIGGWSLYMAAVIPCALVIMEFTLYVIHLNQKIKALKEANARLKDDHDYIAGLAEKHGVDIRPWEKQVPIPRTVKKESSEREQLKPNPFA